MPWRAIEEAKTVSLYELFGYDLLVVCAVLALRVLVLTIHPDR